MTGISPSPLRLCGR